MKLTIIRTLLLCSAAWIASSQPADTGAKFEIADVHVSPKSTSQNQFTRFFPVHNDRFEIKYATMLDLIRQAYGMTPDKILGGPSWLEMNHYDILAKMPPRTDPDAQKLMLQSLLEERFMLVTHKEDKPLPTYALVPGKKSLLKDADGTEQAGCRPQANSGAVAPGEGGAVFMISTTMNGSSTPTTLRIGPGMMIEYQCRNMTMPAFATNLRSMIGANVGTNPVIEETGLKGAYNFDLKFSFNMGGLILPNEPSEHITLSQAIDKQLGLKLEERQVPTPVIIVDAVNEKPSPNPPGLAEALPVPPLPTEFEVASVKPVESGPGVMRRFQLSPAGRFTVSGMNMRFLLSRAFNTNNNDQIVGLPKWADTDQFDVNAEAPGLGGSGGGPMDNDALAAPLLKLLQDRFGMKYHVEQRPLTAYNLVALKSKMKKADPASRTSCKNLPAPAGSPPGSRSTICQNITMDQFAEWLQYKSPELQWPIINASEVEGTYDFTFTFSFTAGLALPARAMADGGALAAAAASDPTGAISIFQALEKQLGMKLEPQKRSVPVYVIDHIEQKPTDN